MTCRRAGDSAHCLSELHYISHGTPPHPSHSWPAASCSAHSARSHERWPTLKHCARTVNSPSTCSAVRSIEAAAHWILVQRRLVALHIPVRIKQGSKRVTGIANCGDSGLRVQNTGHVAGCYEPIYISNACEQPRHGAILQALCVSQTQEHAFLHCMRSSACPRFPGLKPVVTR